MRLITIVLFAALGACGSEDRPAALSTSYFGTGGTAQTGGASGDGGSVQPGGAGGQAGSGGTGGQTGATGGQGGGTGGQSAGTGGGPAPDCSFNPSDVYLHGTLGEGASYLDAIASPLTPREFCVGFPSVSPYATPAIRRSDNALVYVDSDTRLVRQFVPETLVWDYDSKAWTYPDDPAANDPIVATPNCVGSVPVDLHTIPEDGTVVYRCGSGEYVSGDGDPFGTPGMDLLAIGEGGLLLASGTDAHDSELVLIDKQGVETVVEGGPEHVVRLARWSEGGFWLVALGSTLEAPSERWRLTSEGAITFEGTYCDDLMLPGEHGDAPEVGDDARLDAQGNLWQEASYLDEDGLQDVVVKRVLAPGTCEVVYDEKTLPGNTWEDWEATPPTLAVHDHISYLATGR